MRDRLSFVIRAMSASEPLPGEPPFGENPAIENKPVVNAVAQPFLTSTDFAEFAGTPHLQLFGHGSRSYRALWMSLTASSGSATSTINWLYRSSCRSMTMVLPGS